MGQCHYNAWTFVGYRTNLVHTDVLRAESGGETGKGCYEQQDVGTAHTSTTLEDRRSCPGGTGVENGHIRRDFFPKQVYGLHKKRNTEEEDI